jgi:hypothetical protein
MYKYISFAILFLINISYAADLKPFGVIKNEYLKDSDLARVSYLFNRCASLHLVNSALALKGGDASTSESFRKGAISYMELSDMVEKSIDEKRKVNKTDKERAKSIGISVKNISEEYQIRMNKNYAVNGNYITDDPDLMREAELCQDSNKLIEWLKF